MRAQNEFKLHCLVVDQIAARAVPGLFWSSMPFGEKRDARAGARLKRLHCRPGFPDILLIHAGKVYGLELKLETNAIFGTKKTYQSPEQKETQRDWEAAGGTYSCTHGLNETLAQLEAWGLIRPNLNERRN